MSVKKDASGRRSVEVSVEVPGTPEEAWQAIATGPGISSWFVPTRLEEREGGQIVSSFGPGMDATATLSVWDPPHRFVADSPGAGAEAPAIATEWSVETLSRGECRVRVVHSWFASTDDWDGQFEGHTHGWVAFFRILRLYLAHFNGWPGAAFQLMGVSAGSKTEAWAALLQALALPGAAVGETVASGAVPTPLAGVVERAGEADYPELLLRLEQPAPGIAHLFPLPMGGHVYLSLRFFLFGDTAADVVARAEPLWQAWMAEKFPFPAA